MPDNNDNHSKLRSSLFGGKPVDAQPEDELADSDLPDTSAPYQAHARPANKPVYTLHCCLGKDGYRSFQYVHLDSDSSFKTTSAGHVITLRFAGTQVMQVTIKGRNLRQLYDYLHSTPHFLGHAGGPRFGRRGWAVITSITSRKPRHWLASGCPADDAHRAPRGSLAGRLCGHSAECPYCHAERRGIIAETGVGPVSPSRERISGRGNPKGGV